jgi:aryl-alcohol dehydrogenase-like predicted oxidoreductase
MDYRFLGKTGVRVSELCFGTMSFGSTADKGTSREMYDACRDAGVNFFDTANVYSDGVSEKWLGDFIADERDQIVLATKAYFPTSNDPNARGSTRYHLTRAVEDSLRRLDTDRIDVLYLHRFDEITPLEETMRVLDDLVRSGKVLYLGASNFAAWQVMKALGISQRRDLESFVCLQPMYNLVKRQAEVEILPMAESEQLGVCPYSPLGAGLLTGKYGRGKRPEQGRLVENEIYEARYSDTSDYDIASDFVEIADECGVHPVTLAVRWVSTHPAITAPILGARNVGQLEPALASADFEMDDELRQRVSDISRTPPPATDRKEEQTGHSYGAR